MKASWANIASVGLVESSREVGGEVAMEQRFFLTSLPCDAMRFAQAVREHWGVENALQWVLDVTFGKTIVAFAKAMAHKMVHMARHVTMQEEGSILAPGYCLIHLHEPG